MKLGMFADGNYSCWCSECGIGFAGDKRATNCLRCAGKQLQCQLAAEQEDNKGLREELAFFDATASQEASEMWSVVLLERKENKRLREAIKETLEENAHLADGDVCTLFKLKQSLKGENEPDGKAVNDAI